MPMVDAEITVKSRRLRDALEPVIGSVYFAPECHDEYVALGFGASPGFAGKAALPDRPAYFTSRGSAMGQVAGHVVAAAFGVFNPKAVVPAVAHGWSLTDATTIAAARARGATDQLIRLLGEAPAGLDQVIALLERAIAPLRPAVRPLFAGLLSLKAPAEPIGRMWYLGDLLREYRGDSHNAAWLSAGLDAIEIGLLTELYIGVPLHSYIRTRAWSDDDVAGALDRLASRGWIVDGTFTADGQEGREAIEVATDRQMRAAIEALGEDFEELIGPLAAWSATVCQGGGYLGGGARDLAEAPIAVD